MQSSYHEKFFPSTENPHHLSILFIPCQPACRFLESVGIRKSPVKREFQVSITVCVILVIQEVVQGQGNRIPRGYVINRIPCQTDTGRYIPINGVAFTVTEILESHRAPHFIRTVCKRSSYINTACILLPFGILLRGIPDFRIAVPQSQRIIPMGIYGSCKFRFHPGISELSFIDSMLEPGERIFIRPAEFVVKITLIYHDVVSLILYSVWNWGLIIL